VQHDAEDGVDGSRRELVGTRDEIGRRIVHQDVERCGRPDRIHHGIDTGRVAHVAGQRVDPAAGRAAEFDHRLFHDCGATPADVDLGAEFEIARRDAPAEPRAPAGDQYSFASQ